MAECWTDFAANRSLWAILNAHVLDGLRELPDGSVDCIVTSPPYWGLRDYKLPKTVWGGDPDHDHTFEQRVLPAKNGSESMVGCTKNMHSATRARSISGLCSCGAWLGHLGLEPSPAMFLDHMMLVAAELWRVLSPTGTCWINMGDCYATGAGASRDPGGGMQGDRFKSRSQFYGSGDPGGPAFQPNRAPIDGVRPSSLLGMPWRFAIAMIDAGWILRKEIIWSKPNAMPESANDRPTTAHEHLFFFVKREGKPVLWRHKITREWSTTKPSRADRLDWESFDYWYDADAIKEPASPDTHPRLARAHRGYSPDGQNAHCGILAPRPPGVNPKAAKSPAGWDRNPGAHGTIHREGRAPTGGPNSRMNVTHTPNGRAPGIKQNPSFSAAMVGEVETRNARSVWSIPVQGYKGAHFATFPTEIPRRAILAGCPPGGIVLDPFVGSGTTMQVALEEGRRCVGIDLSGEFCAMVRKRLSGTTPSLELQESA